MFHYNNKTKLIEPLYISGREDPLPVNLLVFCSEDNYHYTYIKDFNALF